VGAPAHRVHGQRVDDFVREHDSLELCRQSIQKAHSLPQSRGLALSQRRAGLQDEVFALELGQQRFCERAAARAEFQYGQGDCFQLPGEGAAEERPELRRGDEVAFRAELARAAGVVAEPRIVEHELHVAREGDPSTARADGVLQAGEHPANLP
jgi:hypothetical protein